MAEQQLTSDEMRRVLAEWIRPMYPKQRTKLAGLFEAVLARAEAAEAEAVDLHRQLAEKGTAMEEIEYECLALAARVAELEATLAAQGWRPMTEEPPLPDEYYLTDDTLPSGNEPWIVNYYSAAHGWANRCRVWLCPPPLPPAAAEATE